MLRLCSLPLLLALALTLGGCEPAATTTLAGATDWDRISLLAEASEPVLSWSVAEGERVAPHQVLLSLDAARQDAGIAGLQARLAEAEAHLQELTAGPRPQTIARARADVDSAQAAAAEAELQFSRATELVQRQLTAQSNFDQARATRDQRQAALAASQAALDELLAGTRVEQLQQASAVVAAIQADIEAARLTRARFEVRAPRAGRVDALPFRPGDQPEKGDVLASLLVGEAPIARIFIPASVRVQFTEGDLFDVTVQGVDGPLRARLRSLRGEASFTPYYALTGDDANRIVYRAELVFEDPAASNLPAGLPLVATPLQARSPNE